MIKTDYKLNGSTWNIPLTGAQLDLLDRYAELLVSYNEKVNLTAITSPEGIEDRHFADSLLFAAQPRSAVGWWTSAPARGSRALWQKSTSLTWS